MVKNIFPTPFEKSRLDLYGLFKDVVDNDELIGVDASTHLNDDDFTTPPPVPNKGKSKADPVPRDNNTNLLCEIKRISDGQKDLRENLQLVCAFSFSSYQNTIFIRIFNYVISFLS